MKKYYFGLNKLNSLMNMKYEELLLIFARKNHFMLDLLVNGLCCSFGHVMLILVIISILMSSCFGSQYEC